MTVKCRGCGAPVLWLKTESGKSMPVDPEKVMYWKVRGGKKRIVTPNGETVACELSGDLQDATGMGYVPHWSTCPKWKDFKKK